MTFTRLFEGKRGGQRAVMNATLGAAERLLGGSGRNLRRLLDDLEAFEHTHGVRLGIPPMPITR